MTSIVDAAFAALDPAAGALWFRIRARIARRVRQVMRWVNAAA